MSSIRPFLWLLIVVSVIYTRLAVGLASNRGRFSLKANHNAPLWRSSSSPLHRRNPDAVSFHVDPSHNYAWTPLKLGVQQLGIMLDIGSTAFWVFASQNDSDQPSGLLPWTQLYVPGNSPSWNSIPNATFTCSYEAGFTAIGIVGTESLTVGQLPPVRQHVGVMWYNNPIMDPQQIQGILGLGLSSDGKSGTMNQATFLDLLLPQLEAPLFTIAVDEWGTGTWDFGHINETKYVGPLRSVAVAESCNTGGSWKVANISTQFPEGTIFQPNCGMLDTGWDYINLDSAIVDRYYKDVRGASSTIVPGQYTFPCDAVPPDLDLTIDGVGVTIRGDVLRYHPYNPEGTVCLGSLQSSGEGGNALFGQRFFQAQFTILNVGSRTISFAEIAQDL